MTVSVSGLHCLGRVASYKNIPAVFCVLGKGRVKGTNNELYSNLMNLSMQRIDLQTHFFSKMNINNLY